MPPTGRSSASGRISFGKDNSVDIVLSYDEDNLPDHIAFESVPPAENAVLPEVTEEQRAENDRRMAQEDSIRLEYVGTFYDRERAEAFADRLGLSSSASDLIVASRGNHPEICSFLEYAVSEGRGNDARSPAQFDI